MPFRGMGRAATDRSPQAENQSRFSHQNKKDTKGTPTIKQVGVPWHFC